MAPITKVTFGIIVSFILKNIKQSRASQLGQGGFVSGFYPLAKLLRWEIGTDADHIFSLLFSFSVICLSRAIIILVPLAMIQAEALVKKLMNSSSFDGRGSSLK